MSNCRVIVEARVPEYGRVAVPVLVVAGDEDRSAPVEDCMRMFEALGTEDKRIEVLKGVGHWQCIEAGDEVTRLMVAFCKQVV